MIFLQRFFLEQIDNSEKTKSIRVRIRRALFLWLWFEGLTIGTSELYQRLKQKGLFVVPGEYFFPGQDKPSRHAQSCIRMNYVQSEDDLNKGIEILAQELRLCWE